MVFEIYEGSTVEVESISFVGNRSFSDRASNSLGDETSGRF